MLFFILFYILFSDIENEIDEEKYDDNVYFALVALR